MTPQIREAAERCGIDGNELPCVHPQWELDYHALMSKCLYDWDMLGAHGFDDPIVKFIASHIALAERRGGERVVRAVENTDLGYDEGEPGMFCDGQKQDCIASARAALDEMGKEV